MKRAMESIALDDTLRFEGVALHAVRFASDEAMPDALADIEIPAHLAEAYLRRRVEFAAGRYCAREAMRRIAPDLAHQAIAIGEAREPLWPSGVIGSIAHTRGIAGAVIARAGERRGVAIDIERRMDANAPARIGSKIVGEGEMAHVVAQSGWDDEEALTLVFSAKECVYKALFGEVRRYFGFHAARIVAVDVAHGVWRARLTEPLTPNLAAGFECEGRFARMGDLFVTTMAW